MIKIRKADISEIKAIVFLIDSTFTKEGYGFVTSAQIETEVKRQAVWIALDKGNIIGVRVGISRVYNLTVHPDYRKLGIGRDLINICRPETIRVKARPVGNLSKKQLSNFKSPVGFYQKIGFVLRYVDYARNFWQRGKDKAHFHRVGKKKHIEVWEDVNPKQLHLFK